MNTLTKNRIIQEGDEYKDNGKWKPVPKDDFGLQVMFSKYTEVRRPSEKTTPTDATSTLLTVGRASPEKWNEAQSKPISPESNTVKHDVPSTKAEKEKTPVPTPSGAGGIPLKDIPAQIDETARLAHAVSHLPTVVSKKAHSQERDREIIDSIPYDLPMTDEEQAALNREKDREMARITPKAAPFPFLRGTPETVRPTEVPERVASPTPSAPPLKNVPAAKVKPVPATVTITYPDKGPDCIWTGRNGTFKCRAIRLENFHDVIRIVPVGKRGTARNAVIEFPASCIEQIRLALKSMTP
jgi:hypothetical protein